MPDNPEHEWSAYRERELAWTAPRLSELGFTLDEHQPHTGGERYLMQAVTTTSGRKLILYATRTSDGARIVVKATSDTGGIREIKHERLCRARLTELQFAYTLFHVPNEILFEERGGKVLSIQEYIDQEKVFLARPTPEQFTLALSAFKAQESAHAATYEQERSIAKTFGIMRANDYLSRFRAFRKALSEVVDATLIEKAENFLHANVDTIWQYGGFLTHTDFVPHNIRVVGTDIYLLDASSLRFGNKYEGWARFLNFMELYNPELARALVEYVRANRTSEESTALRAMRVYRLGEICSYYAHAANRSTSDLKRLNEARILFWSRVLSAVLDGASPSEDLIREYRTLRDSLRSPEEKLRQKDLH